MRVLRIVSKAYVSPEMIENTVRRTSENIEKYGVFMIPDGWDCQVLDIDLPEKETVMLYADDKPIEERTMSGSGVPETLHGTTVIRGDGVAREIARIDAEGRVWPSTTEQRWHKAYCKSSTGVLDDIKTGKGLSRLP